MTPKQQTEISDTIECRMTFIVSVLPVCFVLLALTMFFLTPQVPENQKMARPMGALCLIAAGWSWWWWRRCFIRADVRGLSWQLLLSNGSCAWSEIEDYYRLNLQNDPLMCAVETPKRTLWLTSQNWSNLKDLQAMVQRETRHRLGYEWEVRGSRAQEKYPLTFRYTKAYSHVFGGMGRICGVSLVVLYPLAVIDGASDSMRHAGQFEQITRAVIMLFCLLPTLACCALFVRIANDNRRRLDETLSVNNEGITLSTLTSSTFIRWREVTAYRRERPLLILSRYVLESPHAEIRYTSAIRQSAVLRSVIERFVPPELCHVTDTPKAPQNTQST